MRIEIISGSPRPNSVTHRVALHLQKQLQEKSRAIMVDIIHLQRLEFACSSDMYLFPWIIHPRNLNHFGDKNV